MSIVGPRPLAVIYLDYYNDEEKKRHAMAGLPVINTQECQEYRDLLVKYNAGINCECANIEELARAIDLLVRTPELRKDLGKNSLRLGEELFDRARTYRQILKLF